MGDSVTHRPFLRLNIRKKRAGVKRDLFEALLERSCMLRFAHFLSKAEDRCLASLNFWLEAQLYRDCNGCSTRETNRICREYLDSLKLTPFTRQLLQQEQGFPTPFLFLLAQSETWEYLSATLFPNFQTQKGAYTKIPSGTLKRVVESLPKTVNLLDKYIKVRSSKEGTILALTVSDSPKTLQTKDYSSTSKAALQFSTTSSSPALNTPSHSIVDDTSKTTSKTGLKSSRASTKKNDHYATQSGASESSRAKAKKPQAESVFLGFKPVATTSVSENNPKNMHIPPALSGSTTSNSANSKSKCRQSKPKKPQKSEKTQEKASIFVSGEKSDCASSCAETDSTPTANPLKPFGELERQALPIFPQPHFPDLSAGRLGKLNLPTFSSMWLDFGLYLAFKDYLGTVFSQETLSFYVKAEHYRLILEKKDRLVTMKQIYSHFIENNIVHVTNRQNQKIRSQFSSCPADIYREVAVQIYDLLRFQWIDFVFSSHYQMVNTGTVKLHPKLGRKPTSTTNCFLDLRDYFISILDGREPSQNLPSHTARRLALNINLSRGSQTSASTSTAMTSTVSTTGSFSSKSSPLRKSEIVLEGEAGETDLHECLPSPKSLQQRRRQHRSNPEQQRPCTCQGQHPQQHHHQRQRKHRNSCSPRPSDVSVTGDSLKLHISVKTVNMNPRLGSADKANSFREEPT